MISDWVSDAIVVQTQRTFFLIDDKYNYKLKDCIIDDQIYHGKSSLDECNLVRN